MEGSNAVVMGLGIHIFGLIAVVVVFLIDKGNGRSGDELDVIGIGLVAGDIELLPVRVGLVTVIAVAGGLTVLRIRHVHDRDIHLAVLIVLDAAAEITACDDLNLVITVLMRQG